ncbi:hypothetical protein [Teichococcus wenyumeiae]|uniref:hypothetical protein n=1 Tax=Teichococcus wenyumeiae TaxID=2478470 RepID=UPI0011C3F98C|nr:hypothetical protein [Pseudoroseomonas wenyumeiae]
MLIRDFLNILLDDTLEEARMRRRGPQATLSFEGASQAVCECREAMRGERMAQQLESLLARARAEAATAAGQPDEWFWVAREMHVEWIARVVSVILLSHGQRPILPPSREAAMEAARLIGLPVS